MKKKLIALLSSVLSGALIVGGAFAATKLAVTDTADPIVAQITGGTLSGGDTTKAITLKWGTGTNLESVENMKDGKSYKVGEVKLQTQSDDNASYANGTLSVKLTTSATGNPKLIDYLSVNVYQDSQSIGEGDTLPAAAAISGGTLNRQYGETSKNYEINPSVTGTSDGQIYSLFVSLNCNSDTAIYAQVKNDVVYIRADWVPNSDDISSVKRIYMEKPSGWTTMNYYAWNNTTESESHAWPGEAVTSTFSRNSKTYYYVDVPATYEGALFNDGGTNKTPDIIMSGWTAEAPVVNYNAGAGTYTWGAIPADETELAYRLVGNIGGIADADANWAWANNADHAFVRNTEATEYVEYTLELALKNGDQVKALDENGTFYPNEGGNYQITEDGTYTVYFRPGGNPDWGYYYLYFAKHTA